MVCQAETVNQWHGSCVDLALGHGVSQSTRHQVVQRHTTTFHLEVEGLTAQVRNTTNFHVAFFAFPGEGEGFSQGLGTLTQLKPLLEGEGGKAAT